MLLVKRFDKHSKPTQKLDLSLFSSLSRQEKKINKKQSQSQADTYDVLIWRHPNIYKKKYEFVPQFQHHILLALMIKKENGNVQPHVTSHLNLDY